MVATAQIYFGLRVAKLLGHKKAVKTVVYSLLAFFVPVNWLLGTVSLGGPKRCLCSFPLFSHSCYIGNCPRHSALGGPSL